MIELLVVIAIIAILAAILFPVFAHAKESAKKTQCLSNTKQVGIGLYMYVNDFDDSLPMANWPNATLPATVFAFHGGSGVGPQAWADLLQPYVKNTAFFKCPSDFSGNPLASGTPVPGFPLSYALNYYFYRRPGGVSNFALTGGSMSEITFPANKIFIAESQSKADREIVRPDRFAGFERHSSGSMYVYADTHAHYHKMPLWWKTVPSSVWGDPDQAMLQPCPQWFPWTEDGTESW